MTPGAPLRVLIACETSSMTHHPLDGNAIAADAHYDRPDPLGTEDGDTCNRWQQPDEDCPKPWQCKGVMRFEHSNDDWPYCDICGEIAQ